MSCYRITRDTVKNAYVSLGTYLTTNTVSHKTEICSGQYNTIDRSRDKRI